MNIRENLFELSETAGASGNEQNVSEKALEILRKYCPDAEIVNGNVTGRFGIRNENLPELVLDAHIDQIGFIVSYITEDGFIKTGNLGGIDRRLLPAQPVVIHGKSDVKGVICSIPPHLSDSNSVPSINDVAIDTGLTKSELEEIISLGDTITFDVKCRQLLNNRVTGGAFDDRSGITAVLYALDLLRQSDKPLKYNVTVIFSVQEELGERGAKIGAFAINPDVALAVDVSFAHATGENEMKCGKLGKGAMIGISPSLSRRISDELIDTAKKNNIPYQIEVMNGLTSTNADQYSVSRDGAETCTISIPLRNMHTPVEVIDLDDIRYTGELIYQFIINNS
ncbi:MAG: M20/M25/M40 family metallo-hydrolase [Ruminococcus sp.]|nr:M20/M25/M40 family metallo-hydrolase [Ruminococcus sp.]